MHLNGRSFRELSEAHGLALNANNFRKYVQRYIRHGTNGLTIKASNKVYSQAFKDQVVREYRHSKYSYQALAAKYNIPSHETIRRWVMRYTEGKENRAYSPKPEVYRMKSRKTTYEERLEIVQYVLAHQLSYKDAAEQFKISYTNVYSWT